MRIAINQPTYLPWLGYFDLMDQVDMFVLLDSVQFEKQSWQQRNRIKTPLGLQWLTVPVVFRGRLDQRIYEVQIRDAAFVHQHLRAIELNYRRAQYFEDYFPALAQILEEYKDSQLVELNLRLIHWMRDLLGITTQLVSSSSLMLEGCRSELLVNICQACDAKTYVSPLGSSVYLLADLALFESDNIQVNFQNYIHPAYKQSFPPFIPYASALDLILNEGPRSIEIIRGGRRTLLLPSQLKPAPHKAAS